MLITFCRLLSFLTHVSPPQNQLGSTSWERNICLKRTMEAIHLWLGYTRYEYTDKKRVNTRNKHKDHIKAVNVANEEDPRLCAYIAALDDEPTHAERDLLFELTKQTGVNALFQVSFLCCSKRDHDWLNLTKSGHSWQCQLCPTDLSCLSFPLAADNKLARP